MLIILLSSFKKKNIIVKNVKKQFLFLQTSASLMVNIRLIEHDIYMTTPEYNILQLKTALSNNIKKNKEALEPQNIKT